MQFHNPADEPSAPSTITIPIDDNTKYTITEYRDRLYMEIVRRKKEIRKRQKQRDEAKMAAKAAARAAGNGSSGGGSGGSSVYPAPGYPAASDWHAD